MIRSVYKKMTMKKNSKIICRDLNITNDENYQEVEVKIKKNVNSDNKVFNDVEQGEEQRVMRQISCDDDLQDSTLKKRKRKITENSSMESSSSSSSSSSYISTSSMSTNSDDYGTDSELIAINQNKRQRISLRYGTLNDYQDLEDDNNDDRINFNSGKSYNNNNNIQNYTVTETLIDGKNIASITRVDDILNQFTTTTSTKISNPNTRILLDIAIATFKLMKRNKEFQLKLTELQSDTTNFLNSILENPENHSMKEQLKFSVL